MAFNEHPVWGSHGQEAKRGWTGGQSIPWYGEAIGALLLPCAPPGCPGSREGAGLVQLLEAAVDVCCDALVWGQRAQRAAAGGGVDVSRALSVSPRAPCILAQRVARCDP